MPLVLFFDFHYYGVVDCQMNMENCIQCRTTAISIHLSRNMIYWQLYSFFQRELEFLTSWFWLESVFILLIIISFTEGRHWLFVKDIPIMVVKLEL